MRYVDDVMTLILSRLLKRIVNRGSMSPIIESLASWSCKVHAASKDSRKHLAVDDGVLHDRFDIVWGNSSVPDARSLGIVYLGGF